MSCAVASLPVTCGSVHALPGMLVAGGLLVLAVAVLGMALWR